MIAKDGQWIMEGSEDEKLQLKSSRDLSELVNRVGFLPLFKNEITGFSAEEYTNPKDWFQGDKEKDPWEWRGMIASEGNIAYGKLFHNKAGFVTKEWYPMFAAYRRNGYDFDSRYEDGLASRKCKQIIEVLEQKGTVPSYELKKLAGFHKDGEKGFDGAMTLLQMQTYITVRGFQCKKNKKGEDYGWAVGMYSLSEDLFGEEYVRSAYAIPSEQARDNIIRRLMDVYPDATYESSLRIIK